MTEPCIIDIKIGSRTWDPTASEDKIMVEEVSRNILVKSMTPVTVSIISIVSAKIQSMQTKAWVLVSLVI